MGACETPEGPICRLLARRSRPLGGVDLVWAWGSPPQRGWAGLRGSRSWWGLEDAQPGGPDDADRADPIPEGVGAADADCAHAVAEIIGPDDARLGDAVAEGVEAGDLLLGNGAQGEAAERPARLRARAASV